MHIRGQFDRKLSEVRDDIVLMSSRVAEELRIALEALEKMDADVARAVFEADRVVNSTRFAIDEKCFDIMATEAPTARDLRFVVAAMNLIVDLERMGDQAKGIAKVVIQMPGSAPLSIYPELKEMGERVAQMLDDLMRAYTQDDVELARAVAAQDADVDALYDRVFAKIMRRMALHQDEAAIETEYKLLRAARELERFGDLCTNVAERIVYLVTGALHELSADDTLF